MSQPTTVKGPWVGSGAILLVLLVSVGMFYYEYQVAPVANKPHIPQKITIYILAEQWAFVWNGTIDTHNTPIVVYVGDTVTFHVHGIWQQDPSFHEHGFFIEGLMDSPMTVMKGQDLIFTIVPTQPGDYTIICTVFCGAGHANMNGQFDVLS